MHRVGTAPGGLARDTRIRCQSTPASAEYSASIEGGASETIAKILAGHKISGMSDAYIKRNPKMVANAVKAIERHYFRGKKTKTTAK